MRSFLSLMLILGLTATPILAESWFTPTHDWSADKLTELGCLGVKSGTQGVGGYFEGKEEGPTLIYSSNRVDRSLPILRQLSSLKRGRVIAVFGHDIDLSTGDYLLKVEFTDELPANTIVLPEKGPRIDLYEVIIEGSPKSPAVMVASDLVLSLQTRARTCNDFLLIQLEEFRTLEGDKMAIDLSAIYPRGDMEHPVEEAIMEVAQERTALCGVTLVSVSHKASAESTHWPVLRAGMGRHLPASSVIQKAMPASRLSQETFGRPTAPTVMIHASEVGGPSLDAAIAEVIQLILAVER